MRIVFFCPIWGSQHLSFDDFILKAKKAGYEGIEMSLPLDSGEKKDILDTIKKKGLLFIAQHWETTASDFSEHKTQYEKYLNNLTDAKPLFINSQTGKDYFTFEQNMELIDLADNISRRSYVRIIHETHRGKFSFAAHITKQFLEANADLRLSLDISHWCNVAETLLEDQNDAVELAISRADHLHARVGFAEGPQIPDPRAPEWQTALDRHLQWWDKVIDIAKRENRDYFTITPEFGPPPYMQIKPFTQEPLSNQWDINLYMKNLLSQRYSR